MKSRDIKELSRLFKMKQQAAALELRKSLAEQERLYDASAQRLHDSLAPNLEGVDRSSAADLAAASQYRTHLRAESDRLKGAAQSLDEMIGGLREKTRHALNRDIVTKTLLVEDNRKIRLKVNHRDEEAREQLTLRRRGAAPGTSK